ncbi:MAG: zinc ABC transporter substrate-binding protein [Chloroflexi bacterium]|nr:MAG: zinc ABC transporter substrate-binding protein [Chloroflexota bacterium]
MHYFGKENKGGRWHKIIWGVGCMGVLVVLLAACGQKPAASDTNMLTLPALSPVEREGKLQVVATTSIIGDVVAQVGGDLIELTTLVAAGQDPHGYEPSAQALTAVANADVIFINGYDLEEGLLRTLQNTAEDVPFVPVSANISPRVLDGLPDPHTWLDPHNVKQWVENIEQTLSALDPENTAVYQQNATRYQTQLDQLITEIEQQISQIPPERRLLVTNHDALGYFADRYGFTIIGTVIPASSSLAEPSAADLTQLVNDMKEAGICTLFVESSVNDRLARAVAAELNFCDEVQVLTLYTGATGLPGSGAETYLGMMRANVTAIVSGLGKKS